MGILFPGPTWKEVTLRASRHNSAYLFHIHVENHEFDIHIMKLWTHTVRNPTDIQQSNVEDWPEGLQCDSPSCGLVVMPNAEPSPPAAPVTTWHGRSPFCVGKGSLGYSVGCRSWSVELLISQLSLVERFSRGETWTFVSGKRHWV